ncbi:MAG: SMEK domain-containing protein [Methanosarcinales archaeon]|nr:SMEK domain-containing protein [Methanosarcinales archaeon]
MNRLLYFNYIEEKLNILVNRIHSRGKLNILDIHVLSEDFYLHFFNELYGWNLANLNNESQNFEAIDLIDYSSKVIIQVSATNTKEKIESTLRKDMIKTYKKYNFKFISISKDASALRKKTYANPHGVTFVPSNDIYDTITILNHIKSLDIDKLKKIYKFIKNELGNEVDIVKLDSNLAIIIDILSKEDWDIQDTLDSIDSFEIERKISFNNLGTVKDIIDDYKVHYNRVDKIYSEFDFMGNNKSSSVLGTIRKEYVKARNTVHDDDLFILVLEKIQEKTVQSANYKPIPIDELELCVNILVVDAFIRCKIFKNPKEYKYAFT